MLGRTVLLGHTALCLPIAGLLPSAHLAQVLGALGRSAPHLHVAQGSGLRAPPHSPAPAARGPWHRGSLWHRATYHRSGSSRQVVQSFKHKVINTLLRSEIVRFSVDLD